MREKLRLLGILPFAYMKPLMLEVLSDFPQIEMDVFVGHMEHGVNRAKEAGLEKYDAIVSRGDTAALLESLTLPVVSIQFSDYDILCTLQRSQGSAGPLALVGSPPVSPVPVIFALYWAMTTWIFMWQKRPTIWPSNCVSSNLKTMVQWCVTPLWTLCPVAWA